MPTYDYVCQSCGHRVEVVHSVHASGPSACPNCGGPLKKAFAPPTFHFKGSGWARKDRSSSGPTKAAKDTAHDSTAADKPAPASGSVEGAPTSPAPAPKEAD